MAVRDLGVRSTRVLHGTRIFLFFGFALLITGAISWLFVDLLWRRGWTAASTILMCLFVPVLFLNAFGNQYRYFVVFDADSFMTGGTVVKLVKLMEANPSVALIQTPPAAINAESLFGRLQQFCNRLYAPLFTAGSNFWVQGFGN